MRRRALFPRLKCDSIPDIPRLPAGESIFRDYAKIRIVSIANADE